MSSVQSAPTINATAFVARSAVVEAPLRPLLSGTPRGVARRTEIGSNCWVGEQCVVGAGTVLGPRTILDNGVVIEGNVEIGADVLVTHRALVGAETVIGDRCLIAGFIAEGSRVGAGSRVFGSLVHRQLNPHLPWDDPIAEEASPILHERSFVGWRATVIGPVAIESGAYVAAGAIVTRSVPAGHIAFGTNQVIPASEWPGPLATSPFFSNESGTRTANARVTDPRNGARDSGSDADECERDREDSNL